MSMDDKDRTNDDGKFPLKKTIVIVLVVLLVIFLGVFAVKKVRDYKAKELLDGLTTETTTEMTTEGLPDNPVDFEKVRAENDEIYAWISVPNTGIDLPILRSRTDDLYYINKDIHGKYSRLGSIFTQSHNSLDFLDPVTVIYGHNYSLGKDKGTMFTNLHYFENKEFFEENKYFYIYTPGRILTYYIVSAYKYDERHILNSFDFSDEEVLKKYQEYVLDPVSLLKNVRKDATINIDDKLVVLSTCLTNGYSGRYLVNGVLIKDEQTK
ncbi:MAG: class B sortase [Clostridiales bacterium]|nr:class B sortase [Clostridiales bacterium]